ncbi:MAG: hypothetical protein KDD40_02440 [Bdellovibrionales bacterium]|nr:hypothetical protein [Bdellovibrionales bacterium]
MKKITISLTILLAAFLMAACSKDKKSNTTRSGTRGGTVPGQSCSGCSSSNRLYTAIGRTGNGVDLIMEFYAASVDSNGDPVAVNYNGGSYSGAVDGVGTLYLAAGLTCGANYVGTVAPAGTYDVQVEGFGQMDPYTGGVRGLRAVAYSGSFKIVLEIPTDLPTFFYNAVPQKRGCDGYDYGTEMVGTWRVLNIDGYNCNGSPLTFGGLGTDKGQLFCP